MQELHTANRKPVTQADLKALRARIEGLAANRQASPPPTEAEISHAIRRQLAPLLIDLEEAGYDVSEVKANLQRMATNAGGRQSDDYMRLAPELYELPGDEPATNSGERFEYLAPELLSADLPGDE